MHYPGKYSNDNRDNNEIYKDKFVINQLAGNIEFINTKGFESLTIAHKNGSFHKLDKFGTDILTVRDKREHTMGDSLNNIGGNHTELIDGTEERVILGDILETIGDADKWQDIFNKIKDEKRSLHDIKRLFELKRTARHNRIDQAPQQTKSGSHASCPSDSNVAKILVNTKPTQVTQATSSANGQRSIIQIQDGSESYENVKGSGGPMCMTCWGKLVSPSTQDGKWDKESLKDTIAEKRAEIQKKIYDYEKNLGQNKHPEGGSKIQNISKDFVQTIGLAFNDFESFRIDPIGKLVPCGVKIDPLGSTLYVQYKESPLVENVDVDPMPGGSFDQIICDGYNVVIGSNGYSLKTSGPIDTYGSIQNIVGEQVNIHARKELTLGAERIDISADTISIRPKRTKRTLETGIETEEEQQLLIDGNINVSSNAIVRGGMHVEGEVTLHHITAPCEYHITETDFTWGTNTEPMVLPNPDPELCYFGQNGIKQPATDEPGKTDTPRSATYGSLLAGAYIGLAVGRDSLGQPLCLQVYSLDAPNAVIVDPHVHPFKTIASKLIDQNSTVNADVGFAAGSTSANPHDVVRAIGSRNNWPTPVLPQPVENSKTTYTAVEKFGGNDSGKIQLDKSSWTEGAEDDSKPSGEGVRTSKYTDSDVRARIIGIERDLEAKYLEIQNAMRTLACLKAEIDEFN